MIKTILKTASIVLLALGAFYIGGVYRFPPLLVFSIFALLVLPVMFALSRYLGKTLEIGFGAENVSTEKGTKSPVFLKLSDRGGLPVLHYRADISVRYGNSERMDTHFSGSIDSKSEKEEILEINAPYCGIVNLKIEKIRVYDYMGVFAYTQKNPRECSVAVYPKERELAIDYSPSFAMSGHSDRIGARGGSDTEIKSIREYEYGDSAKLIHRNQSAKTGDLWVKELEKQADFTADLYLDARGLSEAAPEDADLFYEVLSALTAGLLSTAAAVRVRYNGGEDKTVTVKNREEIRKLLFELYKTPPEKFGKTTPPKDGLLLTSAAELSRGGRIVKTFTAEKFPEELERRTVI